MFESMIKMITPKTTNAKSEKKWIDWYFFSFFSSCFMRARTYNTKVMSETMPVRIEIPIVEWKSKSYFF